MDFEVVGVDSSSAMIDTARRACGAQIEFQVADADSISRFEVFHIITSIMVFQFVHDIGKLVCQLASILRPGGLLVFAVFNPGYVVERIAAKRAFHDLDPATATTVGYIDFGRDRRVRLLFGLRANTTASDMGAV